MLSFLYATTDPSAEAVERFTAQLAELGDVVSELAPWILATGLVVTIGGTVLAKFSRGRVPRRVVG